MFIKCSQKKPFPQIKFNCISRHETERVIKSLKSSASYGCDEISVKIIKESSPFISSPLAKIGNQSLFSGIFPDCLKYSDIKPIHMNNTRQSIDLQLPFSRLSTCQNSTFYMGIRIFNSLSFEIKAPVMSNSSKEP
jgi:hypothetical protein